MPARARRSSSWRDGGGGRLALSYAAEVQEPCAEPVAEATGMGCAPVAEDTSNGRRGFNPFMTVPYQNVPAAACGRAPDRVIVFSDLHMGPGAAGAGDHPLARFFHAREL